MGTLQPILTEPGPGWHRIMTFGKKVQGGEEFDFTVDTLGQCVDNFARVFSERRMGLDAEHQVLYAPENGQPAPQLGFYSGVALIEGGQVLKHWDHYPDAPAPDPADLLARAQAKFPRIESVDGLWAYLREITPLGLDPEKGLANYHQLSPFFAKNDSAEDGKPIGYALANVSVVGVAFQDGTVMFSKHPMGKYDHIDFVPPKGVQEAAARGLDLRQKHGKGGTEVGVARARDLSNGKALSPEVILRMVSFFARHEGNQAGGEDDAGYIAWMLWGGDDGKRWANKVADQMEAADDKAAMSKTLCDALQRKTMEQINADPNLRAKWDELQQWVKAREAGDPSISKDTPMSIGDSQLHIPGPMQTDEKKHKAQSATPAPQPPTGATKMEDTAFYAKLGIEPSAPKPEVMAKLNAYMAETADGPEERKAMVAKFGEIVEAAEKAAQAKMGDEKIEITHDGDGDGQVKMGDPKVEDKDRDGMAKCANDQEKAAMAKTQAILSRQLEAERKAREDLECRVAAQEAKEREANLRAFCKQAQEFDGVTETDAKEILADFGGNIDKALAFMSKRLPKRQGGIMSRLTVGGQPVGEDIPVDASEARTASGRPTLGLGLTRAAHAYMSKHGGNLKDAYAAVARTHPGLYQ